MTQDSEGIKVVETSATAGLSSSFSADGIEHATMQTNANSGSVDSTTEPVVPASVPGLKAKM